MIYIYIYIYIYAARNWWLTKLVGWHFVFSRWSYSQCFSCCYIWAGAPICYLGLLGKIQKWICRNVGSSFAASCEPLAHCQNVASLSLFYLVGAHQSIYLSMHIYIYIYIRYIFDNQVLHHSPCLSFLILHNSFDN